MVQLNHAAAFAQAGEQAAAPRVVDNLDLHGYLYFPPPAASCRGGFLPGRSKNSDPGCPPGGCSFVA